MICFNGKPLRHPSHRRQAADFLGRLRDENTDEGAGDGGSLWGEETAGASGGLKGRPGPTQMDTTSGLLTDLLPSAGQPFLGKGCHHMNTRFTKMKIRAALVAPVATVLAKVWTGFMDKPRINLNHWSVLVHIIFSIVLLF